AKTFFPDALPPNYAVMVQKALNDAGDSIKLLHEDLMVWKQIIARYPNMHVGVEIDQESLAINVAAFLKDYSTGQQYFTNVGLLPQYPVFFSYYTSLGFYMYLGEGLYQQDPSLHKLHGIDSSQLRQMQEFAYRAEDNTLRGRSQISQEEAFETFLQKLDTLVNEYRGRLRTTSLDTIDQVSQTYEPRFKQLALTYPVGSVPNQVAQSYHVVLTMIEKTSLQRDVFMADYAFDLNEDMILSIGTFHKDGFERQLIKRCQSQ
ncbi:MAG: hypothetical protein KDK51_08855, partial [Deltaproteobacteria bacterium]|nr:hypothetical protein [Deltaproteobacteria bacterium]